MKKLTQFVLVIGVLAQCTYGCPRFQTSDVAGVWEGNLHVFGQSIPLVYRISIKEDGTLSVFHDSPDYTLINVPVAEAKLEGDRLVLKIGLYNAVYEGTVENDIIKGRYCGTPGLWFPLTLKRRSKDPQFLTEHMVRVWGRQVKEDSTIAICRGHSRSAFRDDHKCAMVVTK